MKRTISLRTQFSFLLALLVLLQSLALLFSLSVSGIYYLLDSEAFRTFSSMTEDRVDHFNERAGSLVSSMAVSTDELNRQMRTMAQQAGTPLTELYLHDDLYSQAALQSTELLINLIQNNSVSGAFIILNASNAHKTDANAHSALYIRSAAGSGTQSAGDLQLELGPIAVSREYQIAASVQWQLDILFSAENDYAFYEQPIWAGTQFKNVETERYGYWSTSSSITGDGQQIVCYSMPLLDESGQGYGVLGVEISLPHFTQNYLSNTNLSYENSFFAVGNTQDGKVDLSWFIPSGPLAQFYLKQGENLPLEYIDEIGLYQTELSGLGSMYCSTKNLTMYSGNSPFAEQSWQIIGFVPTDVLHQTSEGVRIRLISNILLTTVVCFAAIFVMSYAATRKIAGLSEYVNGLSPHTEIHFHATGMREIDDLTTAITRFNQSVMNASKTISKILELTLLPLGGFEVSYANGTVVLTEYVYKLLKLPSGTPLSIDQWFARFAELTAHPADGYEDIYQFAQTTDGGMLWLRIISAAVDSGEVGIILDVTKDVEEHRRLAYELDYDALTQLFNRTAFKRKADESIKNAPCRIGVLMFADLDNLKYINDSFGHDMGDRLIIRAGEMFGEYSRFGGLVSRISGDEFAVYLHGFASKAEARFIIERQMQQSDKYVLKTPDGLEHQLRYSSGLAWYPENADNITDLLKLADFAMYEAKHNRKGTLFEFSRESYTQNAYLLENREAINRLLDEGLIHFALQPIVDLQTGEIFAYEALMRSLLPEFRSPREILSVAAAQSKLGQLEKLVVFKAFSLVADSRQDLNGAKVFINSIPSQMMWEREYQLLKKQYGNIFDQVVFEITEAENNHPQQLQNKLQLLREFGIQVALDDFGSGYSNELRILSISPHIVKIDIEMIRNIHIDTDKQTLVENLISFCKPRGIRLVAEGAETPQELEWLLQTNIDYVQGFYTGAPDFQLTGTNPEAKEQILRRRMMRQS